MQRKFIVNIALLLLLNILIKPFWIFGIDRTVQNILPSEDYGVYYALFNFSMLFNILLDLGVTSFNNKNIAQYNQLLPKYFSGIVIFKLLLAVVYFCITFFVGYIVGYDSERFFILLLLAVNQFLISFLQYLRSNITGLHLYTLDSFFSVFDKTLMIVLCSILLWGNYLSAQITIFHFIYAQTIGYAIASTTVFAVVLLKTKLFKFKLNFTFLWIIIKQTYPYALLVVAMMFYYRLDAIMLDLMLPDGEQQASIYAQSYRLMDAFIQIPIMFTGILLPMFASRIVAKKSINELLKLSFEIIFVIAITVTFIISTYSYEIIKLLYHNDIDYASKVLHILIFGFISISMTNIFGTVLTANSNMKLLNIIAIGGVVLNLSLNLFMIPNYGAYGAAFASIITHFIVMILQISIVVKHFSIPLNIKYILSLLSYCLVIYFLINYIENLIPDLMIRILIILVVSLSLSIMLKIIDLKGMIQTLIRK